MIYLSQSVHIRSRQRKPRRVPNVALVDPHSESDRCTNLTKRYQPLESRLPNDDDPPHRHHPRQSRQSPIPSTSCSTFSNCLPPPTSSPTSAFTMSNYPLDPSVIWPSIQSLSTKVIRELIAYLPFPAIDNTGGRAVATSIQGLNEFQNILHQRVGLRSRLVPHLTNTPAVE